MNSRERLQTVLQGKIPDCVPVATDFSNMIPARRTGKPFWDLYLHNDPPIWEAYIDCARHFNIGALMDGYFWFQWPSDPCGPPSPWETFIVHRTADLLVTQASAASRKAIDDAAAGGRFILSTGDQCGRDTPDENLLAMVETARTYGRYS